MDKYLKDLIERMGSDLDYEEVVTDNVLRKQFVKFLRKINILSPKVRSSDTSISWQAHREAEKLNNIKYLNQLKKYIPLEKDNEKRDNAYFILLKIGKNLKDKKLPKFIIEQLKTEKNKDVLDTVLHFLADLKITKQTDISFIVELMKDKRWVVRHSAIMSVKNAEGKKAEDALINILKTSKDSYDILYANATLHFMGTPRAIPYLKKFTVKRDFIKKNIRDVIGSAKYAIEKIEERNS